MVGVRGFKGTQDAERIGFLKGREIEARTLYQQHIAHLQRDLADFIVQSSLVAVDRQHLYAVLLTQIDTDQTATNQRRAWQQDHFCKEKIFSLQIRVRQRYFFSNTDPNPILYLEE